MVEEKQQTCSINKSMDYLPKIIVSRLHRYKQLDVKLKRQSGQTLFNNIGLISCYQFSNHTRLNRFGITDTSRRTISSRPYYYRYPNPYYYRNQNPYHLPNP